MLVMKHADRIVIISYSWLCLWTYTDGLRQIRLRAFMSMTGVGWAAGGACLPAALMAVRHVNKRPGLLDGYNVTYSWADSKCDASAATFEMFKTLSTPPPVNMLLGCDCSVASVPTAEFTHLFNITQHPRFVNSSGTTDVLSHASLSPSLSDRSRFPNFYQMEMPDTAGNPARIALLKEFNWTRVATINQAMETIHTPIMDDFVEKAENNNITIITQELFHDDPIRRLENLKKQGAKIIIVSMYEDKARMMLCVSYKLGLYGRKYVWLFPGWMSVGFWKPRNDVSCSEDEMKLAVEGSFFIGPYSRNHRLERGIARLTVLEFDDLYRREEAYDPVHDQYYWCTAYCYDHIWIAALALNCTETYMRFIGHSKYLDEFTYADSDINAIILSCMNNLSLVGVSGRIFYGGNAAPVDKDIQIQRMQGSSRITVGTYIMSEDRFEWIKDALKWEGNKVPRDAQIVRFEEITIPLWLYATTSSFAAMGILLDVGYFIFHLIYRYYMNSTGQPNTITNIWLTGCILVYSTVFMTTTINPNAIICKTKTFCFTIGFTIVVGSFHFELWRVYKAFINQTGEEYFLSKKIRSLRSSRARVQPLERSALKSNLLTSPKEMFNKQVNGRVFLLCIVIAIIQIVSETVSPQFILTKELVNEVYTTDDDTEVRPYVRVCQSVNGQYFSWTICMIEGLVLVFGAFLALETKKVMHANSNTSRKVGMCLYNTMVMSMFGLVVSLLLEDNVVIVYGLTSGSIIIGTTVNLLDLLLLRPKVCVIHRVQSNIHPTVPVLN